MSPNLFFVKLTGLSTICAVVLFAWNYNTPEKYTVPHFYIIPLFYFILTLVLHARLLKSTREKPEKFIYAFIASTAIRMLAVVIFFVVYIASAKSGIKNFTIAFILSYFIYLIFEVVELQRMFKK